MSCNTFNFSLLEEFNFYNFDLEYGFYFSCRYEHAFSGHWVCVLCHCSPSTNFGEIVRYDTCSWKSIQLDLAVYFDKDCASVILEYML